MKWVIRGAFAYACVLSFVCSLSAGSITTYKGVDENVTVGSTLTNSNAAQSMYMSAALGIGTYHLINFESAPLGNFTSLNLGSGAMLKLSNTYQGTNFSPGITNDTANPGLGFNTTPGGANFFRLFTQYIPNATSTTADAIFSFSTSIDSFGAYFTGLGAGSGVVTLNFSDGVSQTFTLANFLTPCGIPSCAEFFGFTDPGASISSIDLRTTYTNTTGDPNNSYAYVYGVDDVQFTTTTPEPSSLLLMGSALVGVIGTLRRRLLS
jgi:hypothetical protein